ncbi:MAG: hypothetical protein H7A44_11115 [Opitutaceae bacterium]|nr:hypothetical protein [Cephaloticoccus sp.]MCP5530977.1 hypothetical protein [Opitutaceae bacterium]
MNADSVLKKFSGVFIASGEIRRVVYEAKDIDEAKQLAAKWGVGVEGETVTISTESPPPLPEAYDEKTARYLLGGISRTTLYAELATGRLKRLSGTRRVLVTRRSIERRCELN